MQRSNRIVLPSLSEGTSCASRAVVGRRGFTLIELLVVISIIALLIGILLPALAAARRVAMQMKSNTQVRGIHQSLVMFAQGNKGKYPGLDASGKLVAAPAGSTTPGGSVETRALLLLKNNYFTGEYAISPFETQTAWTTGAIEPTHFSYALNRITEDNVAGAAPNGAHVGRRNEWSETLNSEAAVMADRTRAATNYHSVQTEATGANNWRGGVAWNDNHVGQESTHTLATRYAGGEAIVSDDLFADAETAATRLGFNALMVATGHATVEEQ